MTCTERTPTQSPSVEREAHEQPKPNKWLRDKMGRRVADPDGDERRFREKFTQSEGGCWNWRGSTNGQTGHGVAWLKGEKVYAHRVSWILANGEIPEDLEVCHKCDNPRCVNPNHLFLGTHKQNYYDAQVKGRLAKKLTMEKVISIKQDLENGMTQMEIGEKNSVHRSQISRIKHGKIWSHVV